MQERVVRVRVNGGIHGPAFETGARESQAAQFPFENTEAAVLGCLHASHLRVRGRIQLAKLDQQVSQVSLESGRSGAGEDFPQDSRQGGGGLLAGWRRCLAWAALRVCSSSGHGVAV